VREILHGDEIDDEVANSARASILGLGIICSLLSAAAGLLASLVIGTAASVLWLLR
jgi:hypothetical protein